MQEDRDVAGESSCVRRSRTNTSLQSLGLLNETQRIEMSRKLSERLLREAKDDQSRLNLLFTLVASRPPDEVERKACLDLLMNWGRQHTSLGGELIIDWEGLQGRFGPPQNESQQSPHTQSESESTESVST